MHDLRGFEQTSSLLRVSNESLPIFPTLP